MEIIHNIHRIEAPLGERFVCIYLLVGKNNTLLIDTGLDEMPEKYLLPYLKTIGLAPEKIRYVINTHADFDHMGGNAALKKISPNASFLCHEFDCPLIENLDRMIVDRYGQFRVPYNIDETEDSKKWIRANARPCPIDFTFNGGERINLNSDWSVEVLHTPGHTRGHLSVYDLKSRTLIAGDSVLANTVYTKDGQPAFPPPYRYVDGYLSSIQHFKGMAIDTLLTSHYPVYRKNEVADFLSISRLFVEQAESALRHELSSHDNALSMRELVASLGTQLGKWPDPIYLAYPLHGHLERFMQNDLVSSERKNGLLAWRWKK